MRLLRFARNDGAGARMRRRRDNLFTAVSEIASHRVILPGLRAPLRCSRTFVITALAQIP